jgi:hypothetical protein
MGQPFATPSASRSRAASRFPRPPQRNHRTRLSASLSHNASCNRWKSAQLELQVDRLELLATPTKGESGAILGGSCRNPEARKAEHRGHRELQRTQRGPSPLPSRARPRRLPAQPEVIPGAPAPRPQKPRLRRPRDAARAIGALPPAVSRVSRAASRASAITASLCALCGSLCPLCPPCSCCCS